MAKAVDAGVTLTKTRIQSGVWEGVLTAAPGAARPEVQVTHLDEPLHSAELSEIEGQPAAWTLRIAIPPALLADGVQTFVISEAKTGAKLGAFAIVTGEPLDDDIRAELDLLRAELEMLKRAFRRHCLETM
jgi:hypothetical protein